MCLRCNDQYSGSIRRDGRSFINRSGLVNGRSYVFYIVGLFVRLTAESASFPLGQIVLKLLISRRTVVMCRDAKCHRRGSSMTNWPHPSRSSPFFRCPRFSIRFHYWLAFSVPIIGNVHLFCYINRPIFRSAPCS